MDEFFSCYSNLQEQIFNEIVLNWGVSSVTLKRWLDKFYPRPLDDKYARKADLNANVFLPYRTNVLWSGQKAIKRLTLAVKAKVFIIFIQNDLTEQERLVIYRTECLRLWLRINSLTTKFTFEQFKGLLDSCYSEVMSNWDDELEELLRLQEIYKPKRKQTLYHYKEEDFSSVLPYMTLNEAYTNWIEWQFPTLLKYFKYEKERELKVRILEKPYLDNEIKLKWYAQMLADLELVRLKKPSKTAFKELLKRFKINYRKKGK